MTTQQPILRVCAWCDEVTGFSRMSVALFEQLTRSMRKCSKAKQAQLILEGHSISHGICDQCRDKELEQWRESQRKAENNANEN